MPKKRRHQLASAANGRLRWKIASPASAYAARPVLLASRAARRLFGDAASEPEYARGGVHHEDEEDDDEDEAECLIRGAQQQKFPLSASPLSQSSAIRRRGLRRRVEVVEAFVDADASTSTQKSADSYD